MARDRSRSVEGSLLLFVLLLLAAGAFLVFLAKTREGLPNDALNINTASADDLAVMLEVDPTIAKLLIEHRQKLGGFERVGQLSRLTLFPKKEDRDQARERLKTGIRDVNTADWREFTNVLKVARPVASRIVTYRGSLPGSRFKKPEDVLRVTLVDDRSVSAISSRLYARHPVSVFWYFLLYGLITFFLFFVTPVFLRKTSGGGDPFLLPLTFILAGFGVLVLFSARDPLRDTPIYSHHIVGIWLGLAALMAGGLLPLRTRRNLRHYTYIWALVAVLLLLGLMLFGHGPAGVRLNLGFFQPVEVIKLLLVLFVAGYLTERGDLLADALHRWRPPLPKGWGAKIGIAWPRWQDMGPMLGMYALALLLFLVVRDMGPALLLFGAFISTLYIATGRSGIVWVGMALMLGGGFLAYSQKIGVLPVRVDMWLHPWNNPHPQGMQLGQAYWGMASGGEEGAGLGLGALSASGAMPVVESDLIFAGLAEELGLLGSLSILVFYVVLIWRGMRIALKTQNDFDRLLAVGLTSLLAWQTFLIVAGVTGLLPLTGITLPFMARGNTSLVADFFLIGLLFGISSPTRSVPVGEVKPVFRHTVRQFVTVTTIALLGFVGVGRLFWLQAIAADETAGHAIRTPDADQTVRAKINPRLLAVERGIPRGTLYDRNNKILATSRLEEISAAMPDSPDRARRLFLKRARYYPYGPYFAHLIGFLDPAFGGPVGLEKDFHQDLRGFKEYSELLLDYRNKDLPHFRQRRGRDLHLTLDANLQETAYAVLKSRVATLTDQRTGKPKDHAALVVLDPATGETLVSVSLPSYDPNSMTPEKWQKLNRDEDKNHVLVDRARAGYYPPGSTLKIATAAAAMEEGLDPLYPCNHTATNLRWQFAGKYYGLKRLSDDVHDKVGHNDIKMARAMRVSCNLYFANLGLLMGPERLHHAFSDADKWDFSRVKPLAQFAEDLPLNAFGQGTMLASPIEMARVAAAVADKGALRQTLYWNELREPGGGVVQKNAGRILSRPVNEQNAGRLAEMMRSVVQEGTAQGVFDALPVEVAGKTGTAQTEQGDREPHSWFIGYAPYSTPKYAFACVIENGGYGKQGAAPVIRDLLAKVFGR